MLLRQLREEIEHYRSKILERSQRKLKLLDEPLRSFASSLIYREIVHPLPENRIGGLLTLFRIFTFPRSNHRALRICVQDKFEHIYITTLLEYLALRECYFKMMIGSGRAVSTCELILSAIDSYCLSRIEKILVETSSIIEKFAGYDIDIRNDLAKIRFFFKTYKTMRVLTYRICRLVNIDFEHIENVFSLCIRIEDDLIRRMRYIIRLLSTENETRSGLLHYQLLQLT
ncbi:MAG: hypothetical protein GXO26_03910 [Crenarchaeota archaeon]|nr:hypothetical protein [Thermoproteota archaeon]